MNEFDVPEFICTKLPDIKNDLQEIELTGDVYASMQVLTDYTKKVAVRHDLKKVALCLELAEKIFYKGNQHVKQAVKNVFVHSFTCLKLACRPSEWNRLMSYMPSTLYGLYLNQIKTQVLSQ